MNFTPVFETIFFALSNGRIFCDKIGQNKPKNNTDVQGIWRAGFVQFWDKYQYFFTGK